MDALLLNCTVWLFCKVLKQFYQLLYMVSGVCLFLFAENIKNLDKSDIKI